MRRVVQMLRQFWRPGGPPPAPPPAPELPVPPPPLSEADMRWARSTTEMVVRRARALDIDVDLERALR